MEQLDYNLLFRWFVGLAMDAPIWDVTVFTKNRERLLEGDVAARFMAAVLNQERVKALLSDEHFSVDGTLIEAWASMKSVRPKEGGGDDDQPPVGRNGERNFRGEKRSNESHASTTDPDARLFRKAPGQAAKLAYMGHVLMENRSCLVVDARLTLATGTAEREVALAMIKDVPGRHRITLGGDKGYDAASFVAGLRALNATPHVAHNTSGRRSAIDGRTTRHPGYRASRIIRKRIEEVFALGGLPTAAASQSDHAARPGSPRRERRGVARRAMGEGDRTRAHDPASWSRAGRLAVHVHRRRLQPRPHPQAAGNGVMRPVSVQSFENRRIGGARGPEIAPFGSFPPGTPAGAGHDPLRERSISAAR
jgi:hypothetical protein